MYNMCEFSIFISVEYIEPMKRLSDLLMTWDVTAKVKPKVTNKMQG